MPRERCAGLVLRRSDDAHRRRGGKEHDARVPGWDVVFLIQVEQRRQSQQIVPPEPEVRDLHQDVNHGQREDRRSLNAPHDGWRKSQFGVTNDFPDRHTATASVQPLCRRSD